MGQIFDDEQRRHLRVRADLDKIEAESEVARRDNPNAYKICFGEKARRGLESLADYLNLPAEQLLADHARREAIRMDNLRTVFASNDPSRVSELRFGAWCDTLGETTETSQSIYWQTPNGEVVHLFEIVPARHWDDLIAELSSRPDTRDFEVRMASLQDQASSPVDSYFVVSSTQELSTASLNEATCAWLTKYFPQFASIGIVWAVDESLSEMQSTHLRASFVKEIVADPSMLDELREAIEELDPGDIVE